MVTHGSSTMSDLKILVLAVRFRPWPPLNFRRYYRFALFLPYRESNPTINEQLELAAILPLDGDSA